MNDALHELLQQLGQRIGLAQLAWDEGGECTLMFDDTFGVNLSVDEDDQSLVMYSILGQVESSAHARIYPRLLNANLFWKDTAGATLGTDLATGTVILAQAMPLALLDLDTLERKLERFASLTETWMKRLADWVRIETLEDAPGTNFMHSSNIICP